MNTILIVVLVILNALALYFWKPWLGAYGAEKAKNYARQEDLEKILSEVRAVTVATKKIEAKISVDVWNRQKKWEIKRDAYLEAVKELAIAEDALTSLDSAYEASRLADEALRLDDDDPGYAIMQQNRRDKASDRWREASTSFKKAYELATLVCDEDVRRAFDSVRRSILKIAGDIMSEKPNAFWGAEAFPKLVPEMHNLTAAIRKELGIPMTPEEGQQ